MNMDTSQRIKIEGQYHVIIDVDHHGYLPLLTMENGIKFYVAEDSQSAGEAAMKYWEDMANNDSEEFTCLVGTETLVAWGLGQWAGPGLEKVKSLEEWLQLWEDCPEEHFGGYDSCEYNIDRSGKIQEELGFKPTVAYRWN